MFRFDDRVWIIWAVWILLLPLKWLAAAAAAACFHEICHMLAVVLLGGKLHGVIIAPFGTRIEVEGIDGVREAVCALAGPLGSVCLVLLIHRLPFLGLCGLIQGLFNLLPVYPMDGGRVLRCLMGYFSPGYGEVLFIWCQRLVWSFLLGLAIWISLVHSLGILPVFALFFVLINALLRKRP